MNSRIYIWALTSALAGFLFGFDMVVISGADELIQAKWQSNELQHGLVMSAALWGTVIGSLIGFIPTDRLGRTKTLICIGVLYLVSAIWSAAASDMYSFMIARLLGGIGVGISTIAAPLYISEISPADRRGRLAGIFQFNIVFGVLIAYASNLLFGSFGGENIWRWMLGIEAVPALIFSVLCFSLPESPRWLIAKRGDHANGKKVLGLINPELTDADIERIVANISQNQSQSEAANQTKDPFWSARLKTPIMLAIFVALFNQLSGINAVLYFAPRIFGMAGSSEQVKLLESFGIGVTNLIFTFVGLWLIDRLGRRTLLYIGSAGYIISLGLCSYAYFTDTYSIVTACIFAFIAAHAVGQGAVIWVLISEIFPARHRATGQTLGCFTHWIMAASLTLIFPKILATFEPGYIFLFFCLMMVLQAIWIALMVPETKGVPLEEMERKLGVKPLQGS